MAQGLSVCNKTVDMRRLILVFFLLMAISSQAQQNQVVLEPVNRRTFTLSGGFQLAVPTGEFSESYDGNPFGIFAALSLPIGDTPIEVGGGFVWNSLSSQSESVTIQNTLVPDRDRGDLFVRGNAYTYQLHGRLRPLNGKFRPYGEVFAGVRNFSVTSELKLDNVNQASGDLAERDFTFLAGWAIGLKYQLIPGIFLEARYDNQAGSEATYIDPESVVIGSDGSFSYDTKNSKTSQWAISVGVAFSF
jgi:hypothetical protein